jgi:TonB family protein
MTTRFLYPALFTAALHIGVLLGFDGAEVSPEGKTFAPAPDSLPPIPVVIALNFEEPTPVDANQVNSPTDSLPKDPAPSPFKPNPSPGPIAEMVETTSPDIVGIVVAGTFAKVNSKDWGQEGTGEFGPSTIDLRGLDNPPRPTFQASPQYPSELRREGIDGTVDVTFIVGKEGRVIAASSMNATHPEFAKEAERAVRRWRFEPGKRYGSPVQFRMTVPMVFSVSEN